MKLKNIVCLGLMIVSTSFCMPDSQDDEKKGKGIMQWKEFLTEHATSVVAGTLIGTVDATSCTLTEILSQSFTPITYDPPHMQINNSATTTFLWFCSYISRKALINSTANQCKKRNIPIRKGLMGNIAWLSSWIAYLFLHRP